MAGEFDIRMDWSGFAEVRQGLRNATKEIMEAIMHGQVENVEDLLGRAMAQAPVLEGNLRGSGSAKVNGTEVAHTEGEGTSHRVIQSGQEPAPGSTVHIDGEVGFNMPYAAVQHEHTEFNHPHGGKAKYLEDPLKEMANKYAENLANNVREVTRGG